MSYVVYPSGENTASGVWGYDSGRRPGITDKIRNETTWKWPRSWWFYICNVSTVACFCAVFLGLLTLLVLYLIHQSDGHGGPEPTPPPAPMISVPFAQQHGDTNTNNGNNQTGPTGLQQQASEPPPGGGEDYSETIKDMQKRVEELEALVKSLSTQQVDDTSSKVLEITGEASELLAPTIARNPVALRVSNGDAEFKGNAVVQGVMSTLTAFASPSDRRIKKDVVKRESTESLMSVLKLRPVSYSYTGEWMDMTEREHAEEIGFIAQEVKEVYPFAINYMNQTIAGTGNIEDFNTLDDRAIIADLVGAVHALWEYVKFDRAREMSGTLISSKRRLYQREF